MKVHKWFVGQSVVVTDVNRKEPMRTTVKVVGRKYFTVAGDHRTKFSLETGVEVGEYNHASAYTEEEYAEEQARESALSELRELGIEIRWDIRGRMASANAVKILAAVKAVLS